MGKVRLWTPYETETARQLVMTNATDQECIEAINRARHACRARIRYVDNEHVRIKMSNKGRVRPRKPRTDGKNHIVERVRGIPDDVIEDARRRACAPRSLTSWVFGDPPPGTSALDKRGVSA